MLWCNWVVDFETWRDRQSFFCAAAMESVGLVNGWLCLPVVGLPSILLSAVRWLHQAEPMALHSKWRRDLR